jgi:hypothetical protein
MSPTLLINLLTLYVANMYRQRQALAGGLADLFHGVDVYQSQKDL